MKVTSYVCILASEVARQDWLVTWPPRWREKLFPEAMLRSIDMYDENLVVGYILTPDMKSFGFMADRQCYVLVN